MILTFRVLQAIKDVLGITVKCWRPPYGDVDDRIRWIANALDMVTIVYVDWCRCFFPFVLMRSLFQLGGGQVSTAFPTVNITDF